MKRIPTLLISLILTVATALPAAAQELAGPDLQIALESGSDDVGPGDLLVYTLEFTNAGTLPAMGVTILETVPEHTTFTLADSSAGWSCADAAPSGTECLFDLGALEPEAEGSVLFAVIVDDPLPEGLSGISNSTIIADDGEHGEDLNPEDNWSTISTPIAEPDTPDGEEDPGDTDAAGCHPVSNWLGERLTALYADQEPYLCEDIFALFEGSPDSPHLGFGRMIHAYYIASENLELSWEFILNWHLDGNGWGSLSQLIRLAEEMEDWSLTELVALVEAGVPGSTVLAAARMANRYDVDFAAALERLGQEGATPGKVGQFYRLLEETGLTVEELEALLAEGLSIGQIRQRSSATQEGQGQGARDHSQGLTFDEHMAAVLARKFSCTISAVEEVFEGQCLADWSCVRAYFRELARGEHGSHGQGKNLKE